MQYKVSADGIRYNPSLEASDDICRQIAAHRARIAAGTTKEKVEKILSES